MKKDLLILLALILLTVLVISGITVQSVDDFYAPASGTKAVSAPVGESGPAGESDPAGVSGPTGSAAPGSTAPGTSEPSTSEPEPTPTVILSIRCDTILAHYDELDPALQSDEFVPPDGVILPPTEYPITPGDSVFDVLTRAVRENRIQMEYQGADASVFGSVYVQGIHWLYEFSCGPLSGWMFRVDGEFPNFGCSEYILQDGQVIEWVYTCDLGQDVGCTWLEGSGA